MFLWWRDVIKEAVHQCHHTKVVHLGLRYGMILFITSEVMFFAAFFWAFFDASLFPGEVHQVDRAAHTSGVCPPVGVDVFSAFHLPFLNSLLLLLPRSTVTWPPHPLLTTP